MLAKKHRLAKSKDVKQTFATGRSFFNPFFTLKFVNSKSLVPRFTVVVSTKVSKKAVVRNQLKRHVREFVRTNLKKFVLGDYAVVVKPSAVALESKQLVSEFSKLITKAKLIV